MSNNIQRPHGMSQLDYLWVNFGGYKVSNEASSIPQENVLLTEQALTNFIQEYTNSGITALTFRDHPTKADTTELIGTSSNGSVLTIVEMPKEVHVANFGEHVITTEDIDLGCPFKLGTNTILLVLTDNKRFYVNLDRYRVTVADTNTIKTTLTSGTISSSLKVKETNSIVSLHSDQDGVYTRINVDSSGSTGVAINKDNSKLSAYIPLGTTTKVVRFEQCTLGAYMSLTPLEGTVYFLTDTPYIYLDGVRYGLEIAPKDSPIVSITFNPKNYKLEYRMANNTTGEVLVGPASREQSGVLSAEDYTRFDDAYQALNWNDINN